MLRAPIWIYIENIEDEEFVNVFNHFHQVALRKYYELLCQLQLNLNK